MIKLYRAMCELEAKKTLKFQSLQFHRNREKCFSPSLEWILANPCNGVFNNSKYDKGRYSRILVFTFTDQSKQAFVQAQHEWKIHVIKTSLIQLLEVKPLADIKDNSKIRDIFKGSYKTLTTDLGEPENYDDQPHYDEVVSKNG